MISGFISDGELFIIGRIKDILIVYGRNHSPDDPRGNDSERHTGPMRGDRGSGRRHGKGGRHHRAQGSHRLTTRRGRDKFDVVKRKVTSAISHVHGLSVADLVVVAPGSIPITTSGKVRRAACVERYRQNQFARLDA